MKQIYYTSSKSWRKWL